MTRARGFTLLEVLIALVIVAGAIMAAAGVWSGNFMRIRKSALHYDVATLLERKMAEIEAKYKDKPLTEIPEEETGDFGEDSPQFRWTMKSRELEFPDLSAVIVGQGQEGDEMIISMIKQMTEFMKKAVKEVRVTVFVKRGKKEFEFSAAQYFMDYNAEFAGAAGGAADGGQNQQNGTGTGGGTTGGGTGGDTGGGGGDDGSDGGGGGNDGSGSGG